MVPSAVRLKYGRGRADGFYISLACKIVSVNKQVTLLHRKNSRFDSSRKGMWQSTVVVWSSGALSRKRGQYHGLARVLPAACGGLREMGPKPESKGEFSRLSSVLLASCSFSSKKKAKPIGLVCLRHQPLREPASLLLHFVILAAAEPPTFPNLYLQGS